MSERVGQPRCTIQFLGSRMTQTEPKTPSTITPKEIVTAFRRKHPFLNEDLVKRFAGIPIRASGRIFYQDTVGSTYVTIGIMDHGVHVSANFDKPLTPDVALLKRWDQVEIVGLVFNATRSIVVLDHSKLVAKGSSSHRNALSRIWHERLWGKILISIVSGLIVFAISILIRYLFVRHLIRLP
jgi:hypothetical protein